MTRYTVLDNALKAAQHNMVAYGKNWGEEPKEGFEKEWQQAKEEADILKAMRNEIFCRYRGEDTDEFNKKARLFVGTIDGWEVHQTYDGKGHYADKVRISTKTVAEHYSGRGQSFCFSIEKTAQDEWLLGPEAKWEVERHRRYDEGKSHYVRIWVNHINCIFHIEWEEK